MTTMGRRLQAVVIGIVLASAILAGVLNAQWPYGGGWFAQVSVNGPNYVDVRLTDMYGHTVVVPGGWAGALGPIYGWDDVVYAQVVSGPPGCSVSPTSQWVGEFWPYATFTVNCPSSTLTTTTTAPPPTVTITKTSTTTVASTLTTTLTATSTVTTTATLTTTTTVTSPVTVTTTVTSPIIVRKVNNGWVTILLAIITNLAKGFHWLASRFAFKPITQVQADFYVPIVEWGWNYAFGTRVIVLPNGHAIVSNGTTTATITLPNGTVVTTTYTGGGGGVVKWVVTLYGGGTWVIQDVYGNSASGSGNGSGTFRIGGTTDVITLNAPGACQVHPSRVVNVTAGSTISFTVDCTPSWSLYFEIPYSCNLVNTYTWTVSDNYGDTATGVITFNNMQGSGAFTYPNSYTTVVLYASISSWSSGGWYVDNTISPTVATVAQPPSGTTTVTFTAWCTSWGRTATTTATTTSTSTYNPSGWWTLYISVSDSPGVSYTIKDNYGNSYSNSKSVSNVAFASYWPDASVTLTASTVPGCTITPASTTVTSSGQNQYVGFTVSCGSGTSTPTPTPTPTSTPPPTSTAPTSTTSSPPPTSPTTTFTSGTTVTVPTTTGISLGCAKGSVQIGQAGVFECYFAWNGYTPVSITATDNAYGLVASETATFYYMQGYGNQYPDVLVGSWQASGHCPIGWEPTVGISGGSFNQPLSNYGTSAAYTWWVTVSAYCQPKGGLGTQFAFFTRWSPPELPITWLLAKGGTNALAPLEPLYLEAWNEYVSMWLSENGFALDLLLLIALILPILVKPATRRIRLLT